MHCASLFKLQGRTTIKLETANKAHYVQETICK